MKKNILALWLPVFAACGLLLTNCENQKKPKSEPKVVAMTHSKSNLEKRKEWEASPEGKKIYASYNPIKKSIKAFAIMKAVVTSVNYQRPSTDELEPKWLIVDINGEKYMMQFVPKEFEQLKSLNVNDTITLKSRSVEFSPNQPYLILSSDYIAHGKKVIYKLDSSKNNRC